jgi:hypothetical protein
MYDPKKLEEIRHLQTQWEQETLTPAISRFPERQETFITTKAKELGIPVEIAQKLMSSAYVFAVYYEPESAKSLDLPGGAEVSITPKEVMTPQGKKIVYSTSIDIPSRLTLIIYRFDPDQKKFVLYSQKPLTGKSGGGTGEDHTYESYPDQSSTAGLFAKSIVMSARAAGISVSTTLKEDDNFAIFATVDRVKGRKIMSEIGVLEDLRVDAPYIVRRKINNKFKGIGFVKARRVAVNCYKFITCPEGNKQCLEAKSAESNKFSTFELVKGKAEFKDTSGREMG